MINFIFDTDLTMLLEYNVVMSKDIKEEPLIVI